MEIKRLDRWSLLSGVDPPSLLLWLPPHAFSTALKARGFSYRGRVLDYLAYLSLRYNYGPSSVKEGKGNVDVESRRHIVNRVVEITVYLLTRISYASSPPPDSKKI